MSTYHSLTNQLLRRLNENEIGIQEWSSTRGVQSLAKDAIQAAVRKINFVEFEWPFNASTHTQILTPGQTEYIWPTNFKIAEWDSFQIQRSVPLNVNSHHLDYIPRSEWYAKYRDTDYDHLATGVGRPEFVFDSHGNGYGVTPSPERAYTLTFKYFKQPVTMVAHSDDSGIPTMYDEVIVQSGIHHMYMFRGNTEQAQVAEDQFNRMLNSMSTILIHKFESVKGTIVAKWNNSGHA